jgi:hypothetical protein
VSQPNGWYRTLGIGAYYEKQYGDATSTCETDVQRLRLQSEPLGFDARRHPGGEWVVMMPALGYGAHGADLQRTTPSTPANCSRRARSDPASAT